MKVFEMFSGYGGASFALKKAGIDFECVGWSEIDKYAIQCYIQNHSCHHNINFGDCTKINTHDLPDFDLLTGGFPCQSFSVAGKGMGEQDTRGTLFHEIIRIAEVKKPKYMLLENVKGLTFKNHKATFDKILSELDRIGYSVYWEVLNSKKYGIPQNRERVFFVCCRKDIDEDFIFDWPDEVELKILLKDILEDEVDEKYYLSEENCKILLKPLIDKEIGEISVVGSLSSETWEKRHESIRRVYDIDHISPTIPTSQGGGVTPKLAIPVLTPERLNKRQNGRRFKEDGDPSFTVTAQDRHGVLINNPLQISSTQKHNTITRSGINNCLPSAMGLGGGHTPMVEDLHASAFKIRKLTPKECFRLMGFLDDEINLDGLSNTQQYKLAGNGWDINLVSKIFKEMLSQ